jgi:hypothetical protein
LNDKPTDADKAELQKVKDGITVKTKKLADLVVKANKTVDDVTLMEEYQRQVQQVQVTANQLQDQLETAAKAVEDKARIAVSAIGKEQGFTIVFDTLAAPYGAHDITADCLTRMNKQ